MKLWGRREAKNGRLRLETGATVVVIGGGPAGAFFAINLLRKARAIGQAIHVTIVERRREFDPALLLGGHCIGCNYCAGGISPRLNDILQGMKLELPPEIVKNEIKSITVQCLWKNIEFMIPAGRRMVAVYRGSLPAQRSDGFHNFDAFLLEQAIREGSQLCEGEATQITFSPAGKPLITCKIRHAKHVLEADFVAFAAGVNPLPGQRLEANPLLQSLFQWLPAFTLPRLRHALVFELELDKKYERDLAGEILFIENGSKSLPLDMCSLVPKGQFVTVVLIGPAIDRLTDHSKMTAVIHEFLQLSHIRKLLPAHLKLENVCICNPNMVVGTAGHPYGNRIALIGDIATARLYKDGILTAYQTAQALAETILQVGIDEPSLEQGYWPMVKKIRADNTYGRLVFAVHNIVFGSAMLSRVIYQAIITERKEHLKAHRQLENILWKIASGDDWYKNIFASIFHPSIVWSVLTRGFLLTLRNYLTERLFGLHWQGFGRFTTGVSKERFEAKRRRYMQFLATQDMLRPARLESSECIPIRIKASLSAVVDQIAKFGENDRSYFTPKLIRVLRIHGQPNQPGCIIQYRVATAALSFSLRLEKVFEQHYFVYRVRDGFARDGVLIFEIEEGQKGTCLLSIYVAFDFYRGKLWLTRPLWWMLKWIFPAYVHDVLWNHSLCELKDEAETDTEQKLTQSWTAATESAGRG